MSQSPTFNGKTGIFGQVQEDDIENNKIPDDEEPPNYYNQFCRLYLANIVLETQLKELDQ